MTRRPRRAGYTLMEVTVSLAISVLLLAALYFAFFTLVRQTTAGRDVVERANVRRAVFRRLSEDIGNHLAPFDPRVVRASTNVISGSTIAGTTASTGETDAASGDQSGSTGQTGATGQTGSTSGTGTTGTGTTGSSGTTQQDPAAAEAEGGVTAASVQFNLGVQGTLNNLTLYVSGVPGKAAALDALAPTSDLRKVCYWLAQGPNGVLGLARREYPLATSDETLNDLPWDGGDQEPFVLAHEVRSVEFEYYDVDLQEWATEWDGTLLGPDGTTPYGPPAAIRVTVTVGRADEPEASYRTYQHVILIPTANGYAPAAQDASMMGL